MTEKQKKFLEMLNQIMPHLTELDQEKLLAFGEGMAFMCGLTTQPHPPTERPGA